MTKGRLDTIAVHAGQETATRQPAPEQFPSIKPLHTSSKTPSMQQTFSALKELGNIYTRLGNPTVDVFEKGLRRSEGGTGALATASGQAAISLALLTITQAGDEIVSANNLYGGTYEPSTTPSQSSPEK